jgi:hypothetical protein
LFGDEKSDVNVIGIESLMVTLILFGDEKSFGEFMLLVFGFQHQVMAAWCYGGFSSVVYGI